MRAGQVGFVAVSREEFEALGELGRRRFERSLLGEQEATNAMSHAARRKPCQSFECTDVLDDLVITPKVVEYLNHPPSGNPGLSAGTYAITVSGYASINGADADQYAFRQDKIDWQIWIQHGDKPLPLKVVITDTSNNAMPEYGAVLHWTTAISFKDTTFIFKPPKDAKPITFASR